MTCKFVSRCSFVLTVHLFQDQYALLKVCASTEIYIKKSHWVNGFRVCNLDPSQLKPIEVLLPCAFRHSVFVLGLAEFHLRLPAGGERRLNGGCRGVRSPRAEEEGSPLCSSSFLLAASFSNNPFQVPDWYEFMPHERQSRLLDLINDPGTCFLRLFPVSSSRIIRRFRVEARGHRGNTVRVSHARVEWEVAKAVAASRIQQRNELGGFDAFSLIYLFRSMMRRPGQSKWIAEG